MSRLLILTEGGDGIGYGHISRCSAILKEFTSRDGKAKMIVDFIGKTPHSFEYQILNWKKQEIEIENGDILLIDSYQASLEKIAVLKEKARETIVVDDYGRYYDYGVSLIINPNIFADTIPYTSKHAGGIDYVILREEFTSTTAKALIRNNIKNVMITMGGSDYREIIPFIVESIKASKFHYHFACGNDKYAEELSVNFSSYNSTFYGFLSAVQMSHLMLQCDVAISACGQTLHELAFIGLPTLGVCIDKDQEYNANYYLTNNVLLYLVRWDDKKRLGDILTNLDRIDFDTRTRVSSKGRELVKSEGVKNIVQLINQFQR